jgi:hypothetical protein
VVVVVAVGGPGAGSELSRASTPPLMVRVA